ncbi:MAG TPA: choice-of-anchor tandem repeat GloVer-containing protein [Rhizomicrobium sp.]|jgi:uncharacterized repeat protein (TIGR03803 family)|nr:choice-of-anchor tandem repeat GloVer-containing protein [Rhizomicrobium sp.]
MPIRGVPSGFVPWCGLALAGLIPSHGAFAASYLEIYSFQGGSDGSVPLGGVIADKAGNLYGTTSGGGTHNGGVVFSIDTHGKENVLYNFCSSLNCADGESPAGSLLLRKGDLYGTTVDGGGGRGTVFRLAPGGTETVLHSFGSGNDGTYPGAALIADGLGNFYGTTTQGGTIGYGTVFKVAPDLFEIVLYSFQGGNDGAFPQGDLIADKDGNLYGTTSQGGYFGCNGGSGCGTVFKIDSNGAETILRAFLGGRYGAYPDGGLIMDSTGNLYGTTSAGGSLHGNGNGCGTIFEITPSGEEVVLYSFGRGRHGCEARGSLVADGAGGFYGTAFEGGYYNDGVVFSARKSGAIRVPHAFWGDPDGSFPNGSLTLSDNGILFGTTGAGGSDNSGTVFKLVVPK